VRKNEIIYYKDELNDDFARNKIKTAKLPDDFAYVNKNIFFVFFGFFFYHFFARPLIFIFIKFNYLARLKNRKVLRAVRGKGYFIYGNHTSDLLDAFRPNTLGLIRKNYIAANPDAFSIKGIKTIVAMLGAIPTIDNDFRHHAKLLSAIEYRIKQKSTVTIYPERHIWPYYTGIRPFTCASFHFPVKLDTPVVALTTTYHKRRYLLKWMKKPRVVHYLDGPFYPDSSLSIPAAKQQIRNKVYEAMLKRATAVEQYEYIKYVKTAE